MGRNSDMLTERQDMTSIVLFFNQNGYMGGGMDVVLVKFTLSRLGVQATHD